MKNLTKLELRKLFKSKSTYLFLGIAILLEALSVLLSKAIDANMAGQEGYVAPTVASSLLSSFDSSQLTLLLAIFVSVFATADYSSSTIKNVLSRGYSKKAVYASKWVACALFALLSYGLVLLTAALLGASFFEKGEVDGTHVGSLLLSLLVLLAYSSLDLGIALLAKKNGASIALCIVLPLAVGMLLSMADTALKLEDFSFGDYWLSSLGKEAASLESGKMTISGVMGGLYLVLFSLFGPLLYHPSTE